MYFFQYELSSLVIDDKVQLRKLQTYISQIAYKH